MLREIAISRLNACSAVLIVFPAGVFITMTPRLVATSTSTLSTPTPARPTTFSFFAASSTFAFTFVCERTTRPSNSPMISRSASSLSPVFTTTSSKPPSCNSATPRSLTGSATRTLGLLMFLEKGRALWAATRRGQTENGRCFSATREHGCRKPRAHRIREIP
jgi:hypothetical protein